MTALFVAALVGLSAWKERDELFHTAENLARNTALLLEQHANGLFQQCDFLVKEVVDLVTSLDTVSDDGLAGHRRLREIVRAGPHIRSAIITDELGRIALSSMEHPARPVSLTNLEGFQKLKSGKADVVVSRHLFSAYAGEPTIGVMRPIRVDGEFKGAAAVLMSTAHFAEFFKQVDVGFPMSITLVRGDGRVLVREPEIAGAGYITPIQGWVTDDREGSGRTISPLDGVDRIFAVRRVGQNDVWIGAGLDVRAVNQRWSKQLSGFAAFLIAALAGIAALTVVAMVWAGRERRTRAVLETANRTLESRVAERTATLVETNARLSSALSDKETLFREVHHRVKNNLQVVASLLRLQSMRMPPEVRRSFEDTLNRIHSMGLVHELLYRSNQPANIDFGEYLRALATSIAEATLDDPERVTVTVDAEPLALDLELAIPLGLLVNELLTNALKHAFPGDRRGHLRVALSTNRDGGIRIQVEDDGVGLPPEGAAPARTGGGIGLMLVRSLSEQVGAQVVQGPRPGGGSIWSVELSEKQRDAA